MVGMRKQPCFDKSNNTKLSTFIHKYGLNVPRKWHKPRLNLRFNNKTKTFRNRSASKSGNNYSLQLMDLSVI